MTLSMMLAAPPLGRTDASSASDLSLSVVSSVSGGRIMSTITDLQNFGARAFFLDSTWNASIYIHDRFAELGLWVKYQDFVVDGFPQRNVIAIMNGTDPAAPQYLFGAHYDSITMTMLSLEEGNSTLAPGADDDASGVAATIELATVLHDKEFNSTVKFVAFAAEETGLNGSTVFVQDELSRGTLYADTVIMDMIGYRESQQNKAFIFRDRDGNTMSNSVRDALGVHGLNLSLTLVSGTGMASSDQYPFWMAGYPSMLVIEEIVYGAPANPYYHSENDTVDHLSEEQTTVITKALVAGFLGLQMPHEEKAGSSAMLVLLVAVAVAISAVLTVLVISSKRKVVE